MFYTGNKNQFDDYLKKVAEDRERARAAAPDLAGEIKTAKDGNKETIRQMAENAGDFEKVLELKKDMAKTQSYIKALETARAEELRGNLAKPRYYVDKNAGEKKYFFGMFGKKGAILAYGIIAFTSIVALITEGAKFLAIHAFGYALGIAILFGLVWLVMLACRYIATRPRFLIRHYEGCKRFIEVVKANGNRIPIYYGGRKDYLDALQFVQLFEANFPDCVEPLRDYLSPEDRRYYEEQSLNR